MTARTNTNATLAAEICDQRIKYAKLKVDGANAATEVRTEDKAPVSESSQSNVHPHRADESSPALNHWVGKEGADMTGENNASDPGGVLAMNKALGVALEAAPQKTLKVDARKYQAWLDDPDLSDEQKGQIIEALWKIILCFVDLGFGVSPLQDACGQLSESEGFCGEAERDVVDSKAVKDAEKQIEGMIDRLVDTENRTVARKLEERIDTLERQKLVLAEKAAKNVPSKGRLEDCMELTLRFLSSPWNIYKNGTHAVQQTVLRLAFAEPPRYCRNQGYGTIKTAFPFKVLGDLTGLNGEMVL